MTNLEQLASIIRAHRIGLKDIFEIITCRCGQQFIPPEDHDNHVAQTIINAGWTAPEENFNP